jgi:hypothetical protein
MRLCRRVIENESSLSLNAIEVECVVHHQENINIVGFGFCGHE